MELSCHKLVGSDHHKEGMHGQCQHRVCTEFYSVLERDSPSPPRTGKLYRGSFADQSVGIISN